MTCATSSQPTQPASWRAYSSRSVGSLIWLTMGTQRRSAATRPSALSRSISAIVVRIANSNSGVRRATRSRNATSPDFSRRSHGSMPSGATATKDCPARFCSPPNAFKAAARPAASTESRAARPDPRDPILWAQREALKSALQYPALAGPVFDTLTVESFTHPGYAAVRAAIEAAGGTSTGVTGAEWLEAVRAQTTSSLTAGLISELGVEAIQVDEEKLPRYIGGVLARLQEVWMGRQIAEVKSKLQRMSPIEQGDEYHALFGDLVAMEAYRRSLLEQASGDDLTV
ncbi:hypothetical protein A9X00_05735 [Mycobacterium sp. 1245805.9]|nr:hypothetical protein A9X00_05735 [Mycobacterium sp. 1245805.9]